MNACILRYSSKAYHQINTKWMTSQHSISDSIHPQQLSKSFYSRFPGRISKEISFSVPVRSFSSKTTTNGSSSIRNSGPIVWYLQMIKAKPILTKSITSALIYTAADFTSQVIP